MKISTVVLAAMIGFAIAELVRQPSVSTSQGPAGMSSLWG